MNLKNQKILIFVGNEYEEMELHYPRIRMLEAGAQVVIAGEKAKETYKGHHGLPCVSEISFDDVRVDQFIGLIIPGGYAPDKLRVLPKVQEITKQFHSQNKLIAFICHAGWIPISAKILKGVKCTSVANIKDDMINAGANWVDEAVVVDKNFISSRDPKDLPQFCPAILEFLSKDAYQYASAK